MENKEKITFTPASAKEWRGWLKKHHNTEESVWLILYKKESGKPTVNWSDAVDEALCFGWIDSTRRSLDQSTFTQFFCRRKPGSTWSKVNKEKVERLIANSKMTKAGQQSIDIAKQNGSWNILDEVEQLMIPIELEKAFKAYPNSMEFYSGLSKSVRKQILHWIAMAKRQETKQKRIDEIVAQAAQKKKPKHIL